MIHDSSNETAKWNGTIKIDKHPVIKIGQVLDQNEQIPGEQDIIPKRKPQKAGRMKL